MNECVNFAFICLITNAALKIPPGDSKGEVLAGVARAFTRAMIFQAVSWKNFDRGGPRGPRFRI